jgi:hypothetical protein
MGIAYPAPATGATRKRALRAAELHKAIRNASIAGLIAAMALGSVALWTAVPAAVLWVVSRLSASGHPSLGIYLAAAVGIATAIAVGAQALIRVEQLYMRMTGTTSPAHAVSGWRRSLSDVDAPGPASVLEKLMVGSVLLAVAALATWFFAFAGSSLPV